MSDCCNNVLVKLIKLFNRDQNSTEILFVTGSDSLYFKNLQQLISSLYNHEPNSKVLVYDLGITKSELRSILIKYPNIKIRKFEFGNYPKHFDIRINAGEYAWKPIIIDKTLNEFKCNVFWMDAGNVVTEPQNWVRQNLKNISLYSPRSQGVVVNWTHSKTLEYLDVKPNTLNKYNISAGAVAVSYESKRARRLIKKWRDCAMDKCCIAPEGSDRSNHRQDQAVLSVLAHQSGLLNDIPYKKYGFKTHCDVE